MNINRKSVMAVVMAFLLVGAAGAASGAVATIDTETTNSATTTDLNAGETQQYNTSKNRNLTVQVDSKDFAVNITDDGYEVLHVGNDSAIVTHVNSNSTAGTHTYNITLSNDASDYDGLSVAPGGNETLTINVINNSSLDSPTVNNFTYYYNNTKGQAFTRVNASDTQTAADSGGVFGVLGMSVPIPGVSQASEAISGIGLFGSSSSSTSTSFNGSAQVTETVNMTSSTSTVNVDFENSSTSDAAALALDQSSSGLVTFASAKFGGEYVPVVSSEADKPDYIKSGSTYVVLTESGATVKNANATTTSDADLVLVLNDKLSSDAYKATLEGTSLSRLEILQKTVSAVDINGNPSFASA